jgi:predicted RNA-binding protein YlxR (DUF448 family)
MESKPKGELLRVVERDGKPVIDPGGKANGRGVYLCRDEACLAKAEKKKALARGLKIQGLTPEDAEVFRDAFREEIKQ